MEQIYADISLRLQQTNLLPSKAQFAAAAAMVRQF